MVDSLFVLNLDWWLNLFKAVGLTCVFATCTKLHASFVHLRPDQKSLSGFPGSVQQALPWEQACS